MLAHDPLRQLIGSCYNYWLTDGNSQINGTHQFPMTLNRHFLIQVTLLNHCRESLQSQDQSMKLISLVYGRTDNEGLETVLNCTWDVALLKLTHLSFFSYLGSRVHALLHCRPACCWRTELVGRWRALKSLKLRAYQANYWKTSYLDNNSFCSPA